MGLKQDKDRDWIEPLKNFKSTNHNEIRSGSDLQCWAMKLGWSSEESSTSLLTLAIAAFFKTSLIYRAQSKGVFAKLFNSRGGAWLADLWLNQFVEKGPSECSCNERLYNWKFLKKYGLRKWPQAREISRESRWSKTAGEDVANDIVMSEVIYSTASLEYMHFLFYNLMSSKGHKFLSDNGSGGLVMKNIWKFSRFPGSWKAMKPFWFW